MPFISEVESIFIQRLYTGWITLRNQTCTPVKMMGRRVIELYDALIAGNDWEVTPLLSLKRRAGHTLYVAINYAALYLYSWKSNTMGTIPIFDTTGDVEYYNGSGVTAITAKGISAGLGLQSSVLGIGNYLYVGNPQLTFKWDGPSGSQGLTNWGISNQSAVLGPDLAGSGSTGLSGGTAWTNPSNVSNTGASYATVTIPVSSNSQILQATNFGFSVPAGAQINGISVSLSASLSAGGSGFSAVLLSGGALTGSPKAVSAGMSPSTIFIGSINDKWGSSILTPAIVNSSSFGVGFQVTSQAVGETAQVNNVKITIYTGTTPSASPTGSGTFSAVNGFSYVQAYGNSSSAEISNASSPSPNTGPFTNKAYVGVGVVASTDTQVNQIRVYRTTDSGGGNQYFEIANSPFPNTTATVQDATPDTSLQVTSQAEINLGNTPPPAGLTNLEWFAGRMWGSTNNLLWASTGPETLSGQAPNSNWNPLYQWVIPGVVMRNVTGPNGMLVFTQDDCLIVRGTDITNYTVNEFVKDFGVRSYNAVDTDGTNLYVFTSDRQLILVSASGAQDLGMPIADQLANVDPTQVYVRVNRYGLDSILRVLDTVNNIYYDYNLNQQCWNLPGILQMAGSSSAGSIEVSPGVWRLLLSSGTLSPTQNSTSVTWNSSGNDNQAEFSVASNSGFVVGGSAVVKGNSNPFFNGTWRITATPSSLVNVFIPGSGTQSGTGGTISFLAPQLAYRDISNFQDLGTSYQPNAVFGSIQLADPGTLAKFGARGGMCMEYTNAGITPKLSVLFNDIGATLSNPVGSQITGTFTAFGASMPINGIPTLAEPTKNYRSLYYYMTGLVKRLSGFVRHMQFQISAAAENEPTELIGFGIFGDQKSESEASGQIPQIQGR